MARFALSTSLSLTLSNTSDQTVIDWATFTAYKQSVGFTIYYVSYLQNSSPTYYRYSLFGANASSCFKCYLIHPSEIQEFESTFKPTAQSAVDESSAIVSATQATSSARHAVLMHTVPPGFTLTIQGWGFIRGQVGQTQILIAQLQLNGTVLDSISEVSIGSSTSVSRSLSKPYTVATGGDVVRVKISPKYSVYNSFVASLTGELNG